MRSALIRSALLKGGDPVLRKPADVFDRDWEWQQLARFATSDRPGASLGVVTGRRRQGKTYLLDALCEATGGFLYAATEAFPRTEALRQLGQAVADFRGQAGAVRYDDWSQAIDDLLAIGAETATPVVLDGFGYLVRAAPELPSVIQRALSPRRTQRRQSKARLLLCGSSVSFMGRLLTGAAPLRGRASLELVVSTFDFRLARRFWEITDPRLAALTYFVVGGTPAYRGEVRPDVTVEDFDSFVTEHVLNPASPLFREVRALLDPSGAGPSRTCGGSLAGIPAPVPVAGGRSDVRTDVSPVDPGVRGTRNPRRHAYRRAFRGGDRPGTPYQSRGRRGRLR
jgi:hypothetical protein